ncbi:hypothetical protein BDN72DRAFT_837935 [Pluteus cervinus]|uniref:Uncharacterized protein n=1 Tax=Pluteus cervinus TaxID=181527 RepID=A0ACD3B0U1_9AGAR|nr:hypothetical protein BDN72DRAFT_837935 [Pluteus cervinus]
MTSYLEKVPRDVLHHIVYLGAASAVLQPPSALFNLLQTSSTLRQALSLQSCPHLYASIYRTRFDRGSQSHSGSTPLANLLVHRYWALQCVRRCDFSQEFLWWDLRTLLHMVVENEGMNAMHLQEADLTNFVIAYIRQRYSGMFTTDTHRDASSNDVDSLSIWLLCFNLSRSDILNTREEIRQEILSFLRPFTLSMSTTVNTLSPCFLNPSFQRVIPGSDGPCGVSTHSQQEILRDRCRGWLMGLAPCPRPTSAAITLTFALTEVVPLAIPQHLPETRAIANATQRSGPTMEDMQAISDYRTPLFADSRMTSAQPSKPVKDTAVDNRDGRDPGFARMLQASGDLLSGEGFCYVPGQMSGLWEGNYKVATFLPPPINPSNSKENALEFVCTKPMQWYIREYLCFEPDSMLPNGEKGWDIDPSALHEIEDGFEWCSQKFRYERIGASSSGVPSICQSSGPLVDVVIVGETLEGHEQAWGGFRFAGRIRSDGSISFKREPKSGNDDESGTWLYEGHLRYGAAFVGRWRTSPSSDNCGVQGIFSMHKTGNTWKQ